MSRAHVAFSVAMLAVVVALAQDPPDPLPIPDCDGSNPALGMCGTNQDCQNNGEYEDPPTCVGNEIIQVQQQIECTDPSETGTGSTLCGTKLLGPEELLVCTQRDKCVATEVLETVSIFNVLTGQYEITVIGSHWTCMAEGNPVNNSTRNTMTDNVDCNDTTGA